MKTNTMKRNIMVASLAGCLLVGSISAYFTDADTTTNEFTVGRVSIDLQEPNWNPEDGSNKFEDITPEQEIAKDPKIVNDGINDAFMFMEVKVPYAEVVTATDEGVAEALAWKELFTYDVNDGWSELNDYKVIVDDDGTVVDEADLVADKDYFVKHVYAYETGDKMTAVAATKSTATLFDYVKLINLVEGNLEEKELAIDVTAYGIQTTNLDDNDTAVDGTNSDGKTDPSLVWNVVVNAQPSTVAQGTEHKETDVKNS